MLYGKEERKKESNYNLHHKHSDEFDIKECDRVVRLCAYIIEKFYAKYCSGEDKKRPRGVNI